MTKIKEGTYVTAKTLKGEVRQGFYVGNDHQGNAIVRGEIGQYICQVEGMVEVVDQPRHMPPYIKK